MSSTNRGYDRHKSDYYVTPHSYVVTILNEFMSAESISPYDLDIILDPCAGGEIERVYVYD